MAQAIRQEKSHVVPQEFLLAPLSAPWNPAVIAAYKAIAATTVFPEPTSP